MGGIDHQPFIVGFRYEFCKDIFPNVVVAPSFISTMDRIELAVLRGEISPRGTGSYDP
ncbi:hypothetical protein FUSO8_12050 [Fusobacterium necrophorum DJ-2]|uniref:Uncharacterized protein n=1 Tax=Fusobacterium necrophorum DJ-2 TaxID=1441737 RepID=A0AB73BZY5_9FUSO|nr:hypothetical protein FUSO8_12050 [Fusobacterium necrophorum DJ-2]